MAASAPTGAGVYFFLSAERELLYVGKAGSLRSRLRQHAKGGGRLAGLYARAADVRWEEHPDERAAVSREADLLVALQPPYNAAGASGGWSDVVVAPDLSRLTRVAGAAPADGRRRYGCFPHLGPGLATVPGTACTDGFAALERLWAATPRADDLARPLHDLLGGTSRRLLDVLGDRAADAAEPYQRPALRKDTVTAEGFFTHGPAALRALRRRHGLPAGHVTRDQFRAAVAAEVRDLIGHDVVFPPAPDESVLGRRAARSLRHTT